jgi:acyl-CoA thioester hydrolase
MTRLDRARLEGGVFPFHFDVATRFADLDENGHVNNVATADILQEGRLRFIQPIDLIGVSRCQLVIAASLIEFSQELQYPAPIAVAVGVLDVGRTSFRVGQVASQNSCIGAYSEVVLVTRVGRDPVPLPDDWRTKLDGLKIT